MIVPGLVSTIVPVHNRPALVREAVASVLAQNWRPLEVIVVDDGSDDATPQVLAELTGTHPTLVRALRRDRPGGPGVAREAGRREIRGEFVQYLDSDDLLAPGKIRRQVEALRARPDCDLCWGREETIVEVPGKPTRRVPKALPQVDRLFPTLLVCKPWQTFNPLYRRDLVERMGPWAPLWNYQDWEYDGRAAVAGAKVCFIDAPTGGLRRGSYRHVGARAHLRRQVGAQAAAFEAMLGHARACGVTQEAPEMAIFVRRLFHMARRCGAVGRPDTSRRLFDLARAASSSPNAPDWTLYAAGARHVGWRAVGVLSEGLDRMRRLLRQLRR